MRADVFTAATTVADPLTKVAAVHLEVGGPIAFSGQTAGLIRRFPRLPPPTEITALVPLHRRVDVPGCSIQRSRLFPDVVPHVDGLPVLGRADTLITLADAVPQRLLVDCVQDLVRTDRLSLADVESVLRRGRSGSAALRRVVAELSPGGDSRPERTLYRALRAAAVDGFELGWELVLPEGPIYWPDLWHEEHAICVEVDGVGVHAVASTMDDDRVRQNLLTLKHDIAVPRFLPSRIDADLAAVVVELRAAAAERAMRPRKVRRYVARRRSDH